MSRFTVCAVVVVCSLSVGAPLSAQSVRDPSLRVNRYVGGFDEPTGVAFLDSNGTAIVTEKSTGRVKLVENRRATKTLLDLPVNAESERGLLSVALSPTFATDGFVYLYHTAAATDGGDPISNKISRYRWHPIDKRLTLDRKVIDLPPGPGPNHDGGKIVFAPNGKLFTVIGDLNRQERTSNFENSTTTNRIGAILRIQPKGGSVPTNPFPVLGSPAAQQDIWAYGIRNSFGLAFDPVTGDLWDTENGPDRMDEINRVTPGFNSGWRDIMGPSDRVANFDPGDLVSLGTRANYQDPKFSWAETVAPTDLEFLNSGRLGEAYRNDLFAGDVNTGSIYHFELTSNRRSLQLTGALADRVADNTDDLLDEQDDILFGDGFGVTSDLVTGPGGLYVLSLSNGALYRISRVAPGAAPMSVVPEPCAALAIAALSAVTLTRPRRRRP